MTSISLAAWREKVPEADVYIIPTLCQSTIHPVFGIRLSVFTVFRCSACGYPSLWTGMIFAADRHPQYGANVEGPEELNFCSVFDWPLKAYDSSSRNS